MINPRSIYPQLFEDDSPLDEALVAQISAQLQEEWPRVQANLKVDDSEASLFLLLLAKGLANRMENPAEWIFSKLYPRVPSVGEKTAHGFTILRRGLSRAGRPVIAFKSKDGSITEMEIKD